MKDKQLGKKYKITKACVSEAFPKSTGEVALHEDTYTDCDPTVADDRTHHQCIFD